MRTVTRWGLSAVCAFGYLHHDWWVVGLSFALGVLNEIAAAAERRRDRE